MDCAVGAMAGAGGARHDSGDYRDRHPAADNDCRVPRTGSIEPVRQGSIGEVDFIKNAQEVLDALPAWAKGWLSQFGLADLSSMRDGLTSGLVKGSQVIATQALNIGSSTFDFIIGLGVMLYLLFFLLQDGDALLARVRAAVPLREEQKRALFSRFAVVVRATVRGWQSWWPLRRARSAVWRSGFLGIHAPLLWAVIMAFLSLLPAIGAGLVWDAGAVYLLATGSTWQGVFLIAYGISLSD